MAPAMHTLIDLVVDFGERYEKVKIDRGIVDFSDLGTLCTTYFIR